jgi:DNA-binding GntR family transcriptional regulator
MRQVNARKVPGSLLVVPVPVRRQVEDHLREAIVTGVFAPGEHLSDRVLCETFGASRSVVREAIRLMEAEGLVVQIPHRGPFVTSLTLAEAEEIYEVRAALEAIMGANFVRHSTAAERQRLQKTFKEFKREAKGAARRENLLQIKRQFYGVLSQGSRTSYVAKMLELVLNRTSQLRAVSMAAPERLPATVEEIQAIIDGIEKDDPKVVAKACREHVMRAAKVALRKIAEIEERALDTP